MEVAALEPAPRSAGSQRAALLAASTDASAAPGVPTTAGTHATSRRRISGTAPPAERCPAGDAFFVKVFRCGWEVRKKPSVKNQAKQIDR